VKSDIYLTALPLLNSRRVELLDNPRLVNQLCALERRTARGGKDSVDHSPGAHDDIVNAALGALTIAAARVLNAIPLVGPINVYADGTDTMALMLAGGGEVGAKDPEAARAARERAMRPSTPARDPTQPLSSTEQFYQSGGAGTGGGLSAAAWGIIGTRGDFHDRHRTAQ
jgi:hypothetical protein